MADEFGRVLEAYSRKVLPQVKNEALRGSLREGLEMVVKEVRYTHPHAEEGLLSKK